MNANLENSQDATVTQTLDFSNLLDVQHENKWVAFNTNYDSVLAYAESFRALERQLSLKHPNKKVNYYRVPSRF